MLVESECSMVFPQLRKKKIKAGRCDVNPNRPFILIYIIHHANHNFNTIFFLTEIIVIYLLEFDKLKMTYSLTVF